MTTSNEPQFDESRAVGEGLSRTDWQARYDQGKTGWDRGQASPMLRQWLDSGTLQPCSILVPGCGRGHEVVALAESGFQVTAVDFADSAINSVHEQLARLGLQATIIQADVFMFQPAHRFDAIYEQTCLCAIDPGRWSDYEQRLSQWLLPQGRLFALFMQSDALQGPPFSCSLGAMQKLFSHRWQWHTEPQRVDHPTGMHELACVLGIRS